MNTTDQGNYNLDNSNDNKVYDISSDVNSEFSISSDNDEYSDTDFETESSPIGNINSINIIKNNTDIININDDIFYTLLDNKDKLINVLKHTNIRLNNKIGKINDNINISLSKLTTSGDINSLIKKIKTHTNTIDTLLETNLILQNQNTETNKKLLILNDTYHSLNRIYIKNINDTTNNPLIIRLKEMNINITTIKNELKSIKNEYSSLKSAIICKICHENKISILLEPCGHMGICKDCFNNIYSSSSSSHCPICNTIINKFTYVYIGV
tara:strand:+ start:779 stop:1585 length:807 start_codon:yes stop_codon:yes gene_type:complete